MNNDSYSSLTLTQTLMVIFCLLFQLVIDSFMATVQVLFPDNVFTIQKLTGVKA